MKLSANQTNHSLVWLNNVRLLISTFMTTLTKEQIQELTSEQQETLAEVELRFAQKRQKLLEQARSYRAHVVLCLLGFAAILILFLDKGDRVSFAVVVLFGLIIGHIIDTNRRLNALLELHEADRRSRTRPKHLADDPVA